MMVVGWLARTGLGALVGLLAISAANVAQAKNGAPLGYQILCLTSPAECRGGGASVVPATETMLSTLKAVNSSVNRSIRPRNDGAVDVWTVRPAAGDCEDYALTKRRALIEAGFPPSALRLAYVKTRSGEGHAILMVETSGGRLVLDNLNSAIRPLSQTSYRVISMAGADPRIWS